MFKAYSLFVMGFGENYRNHLETKLEQTSKEPSSIDKVL